jgi:parallel beta-helix repeat protein
VRNRVFLALMLIAGLVWLAPASRAVVEAPAGRAVIEVFPGPNAVTTALAQANPGDVLNIHAGTYPEHVSIHTTNLTLRAAGDGEVTIDGTCSTPTTVDVQAAGTTLRGLRVIGAGQNAAIEINFWRVATGQVIDSVVEDTCGNAEYGINVFGSQTIRVIGNSATGFGDAGIYIGFITSTQRGPLVQDNESFGNVRGVIVENSEGGQIRVAGNDIHDNQTTGIWVTNSDRVRVDHNTVMDNGDSGIELDPFADRNLIRGNTALGHVFDLVNSGGTNGNCWLDNDYVTSQGDISC